MTGISDAPAKTRLYFFDTIRYFIIYFVIMQHVALIYGGYGGKDELSRSIFNLTISLTDMFMMPIMFFIAGFFALSSIRRHGTAGFLLGKVKRIWLPWLAGVLLLIPVSIYFMYFVRMKTGGEEPIRYFPYWMHFMKTAASFHTGYVPSPDHFSHKHMWFLSNLFAFFVVFAGLYRIFGGKAGEAAETEKTPPGKPLPIPAVLLIAGVLSWLGYFATTLLFSWNYRAILILNLIHFEPARTVVYVVYFSMGVYARSRGWFSDGTPIGRLSVWGPVCAVLLVIYSRICLVPPTELTIPVKLGVSFVRLFLSLSILVVLTSVGLRRWNNPGALGTFLGRNSYVVYIIHYPIHAALAAAFVYWNAHLLVLAVALFAVTTVASYLLSGYVVRRWVAGSVAAMIVINVVMLVLL